MSTSINSVSGFITPVVTTLDTGLKAALETARDGLTAEEILNINTASGNLSLAFNLGTNMISKKERDFSGALNKL